MVRRIFVEKKSGYDIEAQGIYSDLTKNLGIKCIEGVRVLCRYDVEGLDEPTYNLAKKVVFSEPVTDICYDEHMPKVDGAKVFAIEYLPGQYDQRADSAGQCIQLITCGERPNLKCAKVIIIEGNVDDTTTQYIQKYLINPVEAREASLEKPSTIEEQRVWPQEVATIADFTSANAEQLALLLKSLGLAMDFEDILFCQKYFREVEKRCPTMTEIKMIDTYWSDHCRHTTFLTEITQVQVQEGIGSDTIKKTWEDYLATRSELYAGRDKPICLMDIATIGMKKLKKQGKLPLLDLSEEINACSIEVEADIDGKKEKWLVMFKNETHNHPTEIEPFGGAATCLGGAIRDPLSGRSYVYQAMRVTGSGDPTGSIRQTLPGKLPQKKITTGAAAGYSAYGNQIGLSTGKVEEIYHPGYVAKRLEIGAVIGAAPKDMVRREVPYAGDVVILLGGGTGRDGCGGATGSSKAHTDESVEQCGAEVQKGNPPVERKIQRLFRDKELTLLIKRCNDFGAGGVSVAIGELADGLVIDLDKVPKKYEGLDGTELAISESQERMAVVVDACDAQKFIDKASAENIEATIVAQVTSEPRLIMKWQGKVIVDIGRAFLNSNGAPKYTTAVVEGVVGSWQAPLRAVTKETLMQRISDLNSCSKKGLSERFDSTIGAGTVLMPFGGKHQLTPSEAMVAKLPVLFGDTKTVTVFSHGINPYMTKWSPFHGSVYAVVEAVARLIAAGAPFENIYLTLQEYFERMGQDPKRWGKPLAALLGAYYAQMQLGMAAIGGKDSMSGSFNDLDVPPTLAAFAVAPGDAEAIISPEFKGVGHRVVLFDVGQTEELLPDFALLQKEFGRIAAYIREGRLLSAISVRNGGIATALSEMCFGNQIGFVLDDGVQLDLLRPMYGCIIAEVAHGAVVDALPIGITCKEMSISFGKTKIDLQELTQAYLTPLEGVFPMHAKAGDDKPIEQKLCYERVSFCGKGIAKPTVFIPVFPGTNCEYDSTKAFENAGGNVETFVIKNLCAKDIHYSIEEMTKRIRSAQIVMLPGGFSAGDEPDGSGKFIAAIFRAPAVSEAVGRLLSVQDGLMIGICNGFQALIKLGLVPYGEIRDMDETCPTLTYNTIGRHISCMANTKVVSVKSPWLSLCKASDIHTVAFSHGEGRFVCPPALYEKLLANGQIATQYVDFEGNPTYDIRFNPNGSYQAVEGILSPDGRVLGKMGHSERAGRYLYKNIEGNLCQPLFEAGIQYFK